MAPALIARAKEVIRGYRTYRELKPLSSVYSPAYRIAHSDLTDEEAAEQLRSIVLAHPEAARALVARADASRNLGYIGDRVRRLVAAALDGGPVAPMPAQFEAERDLGRQPIEAAFHDLEARAPRLAELRAEAEAWAATHADSEHSYAQVREFGKLVKRARAVVGPKGGSTDELCRSRTAEGVAIGYVEIVLGDTAQGTSSTPYFQHAVTPRTATISLNSTPPGP